MFLKNLGLFKQKKERAKQLLSEAEYKEKFYSDHTHVISAGPTTEYLMEGHTENHAQEPIALATQQIAHAETKLRSNPEAPPKLVTPIQTMKVK